KVITSFDMYVGYISCTQSESTLDKQSPHHIVMFYVCIWRSSDYRNAFKEQLSIMFCRSRDVAAAATIFDEVDLQTFIQ
ncbi:hypothetical protein TELCIR_16178, partial [Teladorsagia circumcincta]